MDHIMPDKWLIIKPKLQKDCMLDRILIYNIEEDLKIILSMAKDFKREINMNFKEHTNKAKSKKEN